MRIRNFMIPLPEEQSRWDSKPIRMQRKILPRTAAGGVALLLASPTPAAAFLSLSRLVIPRSAAGRELLLGHIRLYATLPPEKLCSLAKDFISNKNAAGQGDTSLDPVFDMCSENIDLYGLTGDDVRPGFVSFFGKHQGLYHELIEEPEVVGTTAVQYSFVKKWTEDDGEERVWKSIDPDKPRNKVERLEFDEEGMLEKVSVVEADAPFPLQ